MYYTPYICHHGVKGMKWGVRRQLKSNRKKILKKFAKPLILIENTVKK